VRTRLLNIIPEIAFVTKLFGGQDFDYYFL